MSDQGAGCNHAWLLLAVLAGASCFSPTAANSGPDDSTSGDDDSSGSDVGPGASSTSVAETTAASETTFETSVSTTPTTDATSIETTTHGDEQSSSTTNATPEPFCGDGNADDGEQCDDGEANALNAGCKPDCTAAACGDGDTWAGVEGCDDGVLDNVLEVGACAPDCSRVIEEKVIAISETPPSPDLGANPVAAADGLCAPGFNAMLAVAGLRVAALLPFDDSAAIDWVLQPYTAYVREDGGVLIWITDETALLGVRDGVPGPLEQSIVTACPDGQICLNGRMMSGLNSDWTTSAFDNCDDWTSDSPDDDLRRGRASSTTDYLYHPDMSIDCDFESPIGGAQVYCVEQ